MRWQSPDEIMEEMADEIKAKDALIMALADRVLAQSECLSRVAEKQLVRQHEKKYHDRNPSEEKANETDCHCSCDLCYLFGKHS